MAEDDLRQKQADFRFLDEFDNDTEVKENSQQAQLNLALPLEPVKSNDEAKEPPSTRRQHNKTTHGQSDSTTPSAKSKEVYQKGGRGTSKRHHRSESRREASVVEQREVIVIADSPSLESDGPQAAYALQRARQIPETHTGVPRPLTGQKRKRQNFIPQVDENQRIFKNCNIFFFPNSDSDKARRTRITRTVERGATWVTKWHPNVTHVVVDRRITENDLFEHVDMTKHHTDITIVNDLYTIDCISFRMLVDPSQPQYKLKQVTKPKRNPETAAQSVLTHPQGSLQINLAKDQRNERHDVSPVRSEASTNDSERYEVPNTEHIRRCATTERSKNGVLAIVNTRDQNQTNSTVSNDDLSTAIAQAKSTACLPLDTDDDDSSPSSFQGDRKDIPKWQQFFTCMQPPGSRPSSSTGPNAHTMDLLEQMAAYYTAMHDEWRPRAYRIAIKQLSKQTHEVTTAEEATKLPGVGPRLAEKIEEISRTSRLRRLENALLEPIDQALKTFLRIYGVGWRQAQAWVRQGLRNLDDLKTRDVQLSKNQRVGFDHYDDFQSRIPRSEVTKLATIVTKALKHIDPAFEAVVGGSYRRNAETSGDIDMIITHPTNSIAYTRTVVMETLIPRLFKQKFLTAELAATSRGDGSKWHGACVLPPTVSAELEKEAGVHRPWRRIDLLLVPSDEMGAALLYFTGDDIFNRSMRLLARKKSMRLNQRGLYKDVGRKRNNEKINEGTRIAGWDERGIFDALGVPWRECTERDC